MKVAARRCVVPTYAGCGRSRQVSVCGSLSGPMHQETARNAYFRSYPSSSFSPVPKRYVLSSAIRHKFREKLRKIIRGKCNGMFIEHAKGLSRVHGVVQLQERIKIGLD
jgi:hypothetical protein